MTRHRSGPRSWAGFVVLGFVLVTLPGAALLAATAVEPRPAGGEGQHLERVHKFRNDRLLVKLRAGVSAASADRVLREEGASEVRDFRRPRTLTHSPMDSWRVAKIGPVVDLMRLRAALLKNPAVERVEYDYELRARVVPNDPGFEFLWGLHNEGQTGGVIDADVDAPAAWDLVIGDPTVVAAVIDTGIAYDHPDLAANMWTNAGEIPGNSVDDDNNGYVDDVHGYDFFNYDADPYDDFGHGTHCAGTIAAVGDNGVGVVGVSWQARIMAVKFLGAEGYGYTEGAISSVLYATDMGARLTSNSWGGGPYSAALEDAIATADQAGALFVAAAGNSSSDNDVSPSYPSTYDLPNVIAVAATDSNDGLAYFSSYGATTVDLGAPGVDIYSTVPTSGYWCCSDPSGYMHLSGTSMATPHVSGAAVLTFAHFPGITHHQVKARLLGAAEPVPALAGKTVTGGRLNALNAMEDDEVAPAAVTDLAVVASGGFSVTLQLTATGDDGYDGTADRYDLRYSTQPIDAGNFGAATRATATQPVASGSVQAFKVPGLEAGTAYHFALKVLDNVGNASPLSNVVTATTWQAAALFVDDMESGAGNWTVEGSDGVGGPALWHLSTHRAASPATAFYYGIESTLNYDTGASNYGSITSVPIAVPVGEARLTFSEFLAGESSGPWDIGRVQISVDGGATWTQLLASQGGPSQMTARHADLTNYGGQVIRLRFSFDTLDSIANWFEGWVIDDVLLESALEDDSTPPAAVTDLAVADSGVTFARLQWTATGDDGAAGGPAAQYDIRYATFPLDSSSFDSATPATGEPAPQLPGVTETFRLGGLTPETTYYVAVRAVDNLGNAGEVSNVVSVTTLAGAFGTVFFDDLEAGAGNWTVAGSDGNGGGALWHLSEFAAPSETSAFYYGLEGAWNYDTGAHNFGSITSTQIDLTAIESPELSFLHHLKTENLAPYDTARVQVSDDGLSWADVYVTLTTGGGPGPGGPTLRQLVDLSAYEGRYIQLRFAFDTLTADKNHFSGWRVDNVSVTGTGPGTTNLPPKAFAVAGSGGGHAGDPWAFSAGGSYDPEGASLTYAWDFGDGSTGSGLVLFHTYAAKGSYTATVVVSDGVYSDAASVDVLVKNRPPVAVTNGPYSVIEGQAIAFDASGSLDQDGDALTYQWSFGDGATATGVSAVHTYAAKGSYTVELQVSDGEDTSVVTTTAKVTGDTTPDPFVIPDPIDVARNVLVTSAGVTVSGIDDLADVSVSGGAYNIDDGPFTTATGTVTNGQIVRVRHTSSAAFSSSVTSTLTIGGVSESFVSTTQAQDTTPDAFAFADKTSVPLGAQITSNLVAISGINDATPISVNNGKYSVGGAPYTDAPGTVQNNQLVRVRHTSASQPSTAVTTTVTIGGVAGTFTSITADTIPDAFTFADLNDVARSTAMTSDVVTVTGIDGTTSVSVSGGAYSVNGGTFTTAPGTVTNGQTVRVQHTSSAAFSTSVTTTLTMGGVSESFVSTTLAQDVTPDAFAFPGQTNVPQGTMITSDAVAIGGINDATPIGVSGGQYSIDGGTFTSSAGTVTNGQTVRVRHTSSAQPSTATTTTLTVGGVPGSFVSTTVAKDTKPDAFAFQDQTNLPRSTTITSNEVTITGINDAAPISINGGQYSINGGAFTYSSGTVTSGQKVRVRHTTSSAFQTSMNSVLNVGGTSDAFTTTTQARDIVPNGFAFATKNGVLRNTVVQSDEITVGGINDATPISVGGGEYSINGGAFTSAAGSVTNGQKVRVRHTSASGFSASRQTALSIGGVSGSFTSVTEVEDTTPDAFTFQDQSGVAPLVEVTSNAITVTGINSNSAISVSGGTYAVNGGAYTSASGTVKAGDAVTLRVTAGAVPQSAVNTTLTIGGVSDTWTVRTLP